MMEKYIKEEEIINKLKEFYDEAVAKRAFGQDFDNSEDYKNLQIKLLQTTQEFTRSFEYELENTPTIKRKAIVFIKKAIRKMSRFMLKPYADQMLIYQERNGELSGEIVKLILNQGKKIENSKYILDEHDNIIEKFGKLILNQNKETEESNELLKKYKKLKEEQESKIQDLKEHLWKHEEAIYKLANDYNSTVATVLDISDKINKHDDGANLSYSQAGEDKIIYFLMNYGKSEKAIFSYLDIGCNHYKNLNNTYKFYNEGMKGLLLDANPNFISLAQEHRERDICLNAGISSCNSDALKFYVLSNPDLSSFNKEVVDATIKESPWLKIEKEIMVSVVTINQLIDKYFTKTPEVISLDIEGDELNVLKTMDFNKYRPRIFVIETIEYKEKITLDNKRNDIVEFMEKQGYKEYAFTGVNSIFVNKSVFTEDNI